MKESSNSGFTLIELLVSISLLMIIAVIVSGSLRLGYRSLSAGEKLARGNDRLRTSLNIIDAQLQSQFPFRTGDEKERKMYFKGSRDFLQFTTNYSFWGSRKGFLLVTYEVLENETRQKTLYASERLIGCRNVRKTNLLDGMDEIYFEFYEKSQDEGPCWVEQWKDDQTIPFKIRLNVVDKSCRETLLIPVRVVNAKNAWS